MEYKPVVSGSGDDRGDVKCHEKARKKKAKRENRTTAIENRWYYTGFVMHGNITVPCHMRITAFLIPILNTILAI